MSNTQTLKDVELERYYQDQFAMYGSHGWLGLMEDLAYMLKTAEKLDGIDTAEQLHFRKGEINILRMLLSYKETRETAYRAALAEDNGGEEEESTGGEAKVVS